MLTINLSNNLYSPIEMLINLITNFLHLESAEVGLINYLVKNVVKFVKAVNCWLIFAVF